MVDHPKPQQDNKVHQFRAPGERGDEGAPPGAAPVPGPNQVVGGGGGPPYESKGIRAFALLLPRIEFPISKDRLIQQLGHARIAVDSHRTRSIHEVLEHTVPERFESREVLEQAVERALRDFKTPGARNP